MDDSLKPPARTRRPMILLSVGAVVGIFLAATGLLGAGQGGGVVLPSDAVARINGALIRTEDYRRTVAAVASDRRDGIDDAQRQHVLDRLIDEELLVQRGLELGLVQHDRKVRADLTTAVISSVLAEAQDVQPTDPELKAFYDTHRAFFARVGRLRVRQIFCRSATADGTTQAQERATQASRRLRSGEGFGAVQAALGDPDVAPLPDALLPPEKLVDYIGPTALHAVLPLAVGDVSDPVRSGAGFHVFQVVERQPDVTPPFAQIKAQVIAEFRRRKGEEALRAYLDDLRAHADVTIASHLP